MNKECPPTLKEEVDAVDRLVPEVRESIEP